MALNRRRHVVLVGGLGWTGAQVLAAARAHDCQLTLIQEADKVTDQHRAVAGRVIEVADLSDVHAITALAERLHAEHPVDYVLSVTEFGLVTAASVAQALRVPTPVSTEVATLLRSKGRMRDKLCGHPELAVRSRLCETLDEALNAFGEVGGPAIVKPDAAWGSLCVRRVDDRAQLELAFEEASSVGDAVMVEEYLCGPEFSVEAMSHEGRHHILAVTRKIKLENFVEVGHVIPGAADDDAREITDLAERFLDVVGLTNGNSHTEIIRTPSGPKIVESHNRPGGDSIPYLIELATGINLAELAVTVPLRLQSLPPKPTSHRGAAIHFWVGEPGIVEDVPQVPETVEDRCAQIHLLAHPGRRVREVLHSFDRLGYVITTAESGEEASALARRTVEAHPFVIRPNADDVEATSERLDRVRRYACGG